MNKLLYKEDDYEKVTYHLLGIKFKFPSKGYFPLSPNNNVKISVVINTYNADRLLEQAIKSVQNADEIIICDMHSTDRTIEIAQKYNCKICYHDKLPQPDPARNFAISQATGDWILILDADEIIPKQLWEYLVSYANNPLENKFVVSIPRKNYFLNGFIENFGDDRQLRFFKKGHIKYDEGFVHVPPRIIDTEEYRIKSLYMYHYSYANLTQFIDRFNIYTSEEVKKQNKKLVFSKLDILKFVIEQISLLFKIKTFKNNSNELAINFISNYRFMIYLKTLEKQENWEELQQQDAESRI